MNTLLTILSLILIFIAVVLVALNRYLWDAALLFLLALIAFIIVLFRKPDEITSPRHTLQHLMPKSMGVWLRAGSGIISVFVALTAMPLPMNSNFLSLFLLWAAGMVMLCLSFIVPWIRQQGTKKETFSKIEKIALITLIIVSAVIRGVGIGRIPANLGGDEGTQLLLGADLVSKPFGNPFATGWFSVPTMSFAIYGLVMRLWGTTMAGGRMLSVIIGTLTILLTFLLGRSLGGRRFGWVSAFFMAFSAYHIHYSRLASNQIFDPFIGTCVFWLIQKAVDKQTTGKSESSVYAWGMAGVVAGFGWYAYFGARWVTFLLGLVIILRWVFHRNFIRQHAKGILMFVLAWIIITLPLLGWYYEHPSSLTERFRAVSVFASGWLSREIIITGKTAVRLMLEQFWKAVTAFHLTTDPTFWYYPERPLVDFVTGLFMLVGMVVCFWNLKWPSKSLILLWFWSTLIMAWVMTENPPSSQRGLLLLPAVTFLTAWGVETFWSIINFRKKRYRFVLVLLILFSAVLNLTFYFGQYTPRRSYGNPTAEIATRVAQYTLANPMPVCADFKGTHCDGMIYFLGPPRLYWEFGSMAFMLRDFPGVDVMSREIPNDINIPARFILIDGRIGEIGRLMQAYPDGEIKHIVNNKSQTIALIYDWMP